MRNETNRAVRRAALGALTLIAVAIAGLIVAQMAAPAPAAASSGGKIGFSGNPDEGGRTCGQCHGGGSMPTVVLDGPTTVGPGETHAYTLTIEGGPGVEGGLNVSAEDGVFTALPGATDLDVQAGEVTHTRPKPADGAARVAFSFLWTAPDEPTEIHVYGAGNSVNGNGNQYGDGAAAAVLLVAVSGGVHPTATREEPTEPPPTETPVEPTSTVTSPAEPTATATEKPTPTGEHVILLPRLHNSE